MKVFEISIIIDQIDEIILNSEKERKVPPIHTRLEAKFKPFFLKRICIQQHTCASYAGDWGGHRALQMNPTIILNKSYISKSLANGNYEYECHFLKGPFICPDLFSAY